MAKLVFIFSTILLFTSNSFSQKNLNHGFIFRDAKEPRNNPFRVAKNPQHRAELALIYVEIPEFNPKEYLREKHNPKVQKSVNALLQKPEMSSYGRSVLHYESFLYKSKYAFIGDTIYQIRALYRSPEPFLSSDTTYLKSDEWFEERFSIVPFNPVINGWNDLMTHYNQVLNLADEKGQKFIKMALLRYVDESYLLEFLGDYVRNRTSFSSPDELNVFSCRLYLDYLQSRELEPEIVAILEVVQAAYVQTNFQGDEDLLSITPSINYKRDNAHWVGGEIALEFSSNRYMYRPYRFERLDGYARMSFFHFGVNFQLPSDGLREYYFGLTRFSNLFGLYCKLVQFGFIRNIPNINKSAWFYKPQIGLSYGNFQIYYSFTHVFEKELRYVVPNHALNLRFSLPLYRIQQYSY